MSSDAQKNKGFLLPDVLPEGRTCVSFEIPNAPEFVAAVRGHVWQLSKYWNWERTDDKPLAVDAARLFFDAIEETLCVGDGMKITGDGCSKLYVQNCGDEEPTQVLDLSCAVDKTAAAADIAAAKQTLAELVRLFSTGGPGAIAPNASTALLADRENAICGASHAIIQVIAAAELKRRQEANNVIQRIAQVVLQFIIDFALFWMFGLPLAVAVAVSDFLASAIASRIHILDEVALQSATRLNATACCLATAAAGTIPMPNVLAAAVDTCTSPDVVPELFDAFQDMNVYVSFLDLIEGAIDRVEQGFYTCSCDWENPEGEILWPTGTVEYSGVVVGDVSSTLQYLKFALHGPPDFDAYVCQDGPHEECPYTYRKWGWIEIPLYLPKCDSLFVEVRGYCAYIVSTPGQETNYTYYLYDANDNQVLAAAYSPEWTDNPVAYRATGFVLGAVPAEGAYTLRLYNSRCTNNEIANRIRIDRVRVWTNRDSDNYHEVI
jgi:hypothetical protein